MSYADDEGYYFDSEMEEQYLKKQSNKYKQSKTKTMGTISKVTSVQANGTWESKYGLMYRFDYEFADGTSLQASHQKAENAFVVGTEVEYEVKKDDPKYGKSGNVGKPKEQNFAQKENQVFVPDEKKANVQKAIIYQSAMKEAVGFHNMVGFKQGSSTLSSLEQLCETAEYLAQFTIKKSGV